MQQLPLGRLLLPTRPHCPFYSTHCHDMTPVMFFPIFKLHASFLKKERTYIAVSFCLRPHSAELRNHSWWTWGAIWVTGDWTQVCCIQSKCPVHCTLLPDSNVPSMYWHVGISRQIDLMTLIHFHSKIASVYSNKCFRTIPHLPYPKKSNNKKNIHYV